MNRKLLFGIWKPEIVIVITLWFWLTSHGYVCALVVFTSSKTSASPKSWNSSLLLGLQKHSDGWMGKSSAMCQTFSKAFFTKISAICNTIIYDIKNYNIFSLMESTLIHFSYYCITLLSFLQTFIYRQSPVKKPDIKTSK